jgi:hypothetical protein
MTRLKYDYEMLTNICHEGGVKLLVDYKDTYKMVKIIDIL